MPRVLRDYISIAEHAAAGQIDGSIDLTHIVNDAGRYLFGMHEWTWRDKRADLGLTDGQPYVNLPANFDQLVEVGSLSRYQLAVHRVQRDQFDKVRGDAIINPVEWYVTLEWPDQADTTSAPANARLAVYPTPSGDESDALFVTYRSKWVELTAMTAVPNIPPDTESLLVQLVRAFAVGEASGQGAVGPIEAIEQSGMVRSLKAKYGLTQDTEGPMEGGILQRQTTPPPYLHSSIATYVSGP